jgi:hypothetical protein
MHSSKTQNNLFVVDAREKWAFHHISTPLFHSIFLRGHSEVYKLQSILGKFFLNHHCFLLHDHFGEFIVGLAHSTKSLVVHVM